MKEVENKYKCIPFWSWNDELDPKKLVDQIDWMYKNGVGGFFMHARGGLKTEYLGEKWFECIEACEKRAEELGMEAYAYDENGWPSGFVGGKLLEDIENHDCYLTFTEGAYDEKAFVSYDMSGNALKRVANGEKACGENYLNVYRHYAASTADILNPEVVSQFLALTHEEYKKRDKNGLIGFFTDEPQYYRWDTAFTKVLPPYFKEKYGEDILDGLGLLFVEKEGYRAFRYKYWRSMQELMLENFAKRIYTWCDERGYKLTGHYVEESTFEGQMWCCGGIMPFYEYEHIPGIDWLGRWLSGEAPYKQVGSVAAQLGKKQVITETYGCCGWDVTPEELKEIAEYQYVNGVNLMCQHLLPYTEHGQRKRDYPAHFSEVNPWVKNDFKTFNDYFSVLGKTLSESEEIVNVGVMHPIRSVYLNYKRYEANGGEETIKLNKSFNDLVDGLAKKHVPHHYIDETILAKHGKVVGKHLVVGKCAYDFIIFPKMYTMDKTTAKLLEEFVGVGGRVLLMDEKPEYLEGVKHEFPWLSSNVTMEEIASAQEYFVDCNSEYLRTTLRVDEKGRKFIYAVNFGGHGETTATIKAKGCTALDWYDILQDKYVKLDTTVHFDEGQTYLLYLSDGVGAKKKFLRELKLGKTFTVKGAPKNYITLDCARYSFDGETYGDSMHHMAIFNELLDKRYAGKLYLKYEFNLDVIPSVCELLAEDTNTLKVQINGIKVERTGSSDVEEALFAYEVAKHLKKGLNEVVIEIDYFQGENVYYALFGENVTESLKNCLAYDTDIEAIYLKGDFGVYGDFTEGRLETILLGDNFRIGERKTEVSELITDGYPFFCGDIVLEQKVNVEETDCELVIDKRFQLISVKVNGKNAGKMMFSSRLDISEFLVKGENVIEITLTIGNRNLLGPFHTHWQEDFSVGPYTFERMGTWKNGKSEHYREGYSFVKTIV